MNRIALFAFVLAACGSSRQVPTSQTRYVPPDTDRPPSTGAGEASCDDVATNLAAIDLGNHADEEELGPLLAKYKSSCTKHELSQDERDCMFEATDHPTVSWCAPRMTPGAAVAVVPPRDCPDAVRQLRLQAAAAQGPQPNRIYEKQIAVVQTSCEQDRWTLAFRDCVRSVPYPGYVTAYCAGAGPAPLRRKLDDRLAAVK